jgi:glycosyltransferase involved in cell wall biosynthesis
MNRPLRICFVGYRGNMRCGGQGVYLWFLARELARMGHSIDVLVGPPFPDPMPFAREVVQLPNEQFWAKWFMRDWPHFLPRPKPLRVFEPLNFYELASSRLGFLPEPFAFSCRALRALSQRLQRGIRYDLIHDVQCLGYGLLGIRALGLPMVTTIHHPLTVDRRASFVRDETMTDAIGTMQFYPIGMQSFVARRMDRVLTSSSASRRAILRDFAVRSDRLEMVWNGLDTDLFSPDPDAPRRENEILCVGRASDPNKGIRTLIAALAKLPVSVRLTLVDQSQTDNDARKWARSLGCADRIDVTGSIATDALVGLYRRATLVVVPSRYEGFGLPAVEAMACGTPVVSTSAGALPEVMRVGTGGLLVPADDADALAKAIGTLLEQPETRHEMGRRARPLVEAAFSWPHVAERTCGIYRKMLAQRSRARANQYAARPNLAAAVSSSGGTTRRRDLPTA